MSTFWKQWTINCGIGELLGIACAGGIAFVANSFIGEPQSFGAKVLVLFAMMLAGLVEGSVLSYFQWRVLVRRFSRMPRREWWFYTALVAVVGWFLGMLPSLFFVPNQPATGSVEGGVNFEHPLVFAGLSIGMGLVLGALFGWFQWFSLRKYAERAHHWITANALGWGAGLGWIYLFASLPEAESPLWFNIAMGIFGGILAGFSVGAITGWFLDRFKLKNQ